MFVADAFNRVTSSSWGAADQGGAWSYNAATSNYSVSSGTASLTVGTAGGAAAAFLAETAATSADIRVTVGSDKSGTGSAGSYIYVLGRRVANQQQYRARIRLRPDNKIGLLVTYNAGSSTEVGLGSEVTVSGVTYTAGTQLNVRFQVSGTTPTSLKLKVWPTSATEPATWQVSTTDSTASLQTAGYVGLGGFVSSGAAALPVTFAFGNLTVRPVP